MSGLRFLGRADSALEWMLMAVLCLRRDDFASGARGVKIYTTGYQTVKLADIKLCAEKLDAKVVDIRFFPFSKDRSKCIGALEQFFGWRYLHLREFGNRNFRGGPHQINDFVSGFRQLRLIDRPVILMCCCWNADLCHRSTLGRLLRVHSYEPEELTEFARALTEVPRLDV